jgi:hypothetical protein
MKNEKLYKAVKRMVFFLNKNNKINKKIRKNNKRKI